MSYRCEFCQREFQRESTIAVHMCEPKRRRLGRGERGPELGFQAYIRFYEITQGSARTRTWEDFCDSPYYRAFVKWGRYCVDTRVLNPPQFLEWLLRQNRKIDHWATDRQYEEFLLDYLRRESVTDALARSIEWSLTWAEANQAPAHDCLRYGNTNAICHAITTGKLTAWTIYNSESGQALLARLVPEQVSMIWPWIDTDIWQRRFREYPADQAYAQEILKKAGW
jgi:hypothetical protein